AQFRWVIVLAGMIVGFLVGLTGVGGGTLLTPLLIVLGIRPTIAVGSDLLYGSLTKLAGTLQHAQRGSIQWDWVRYMAMGSVPATLAAVYLLHTVQSRLGSADEFVQFSLGIVLLLATVLILASEVYGRLRGTPAEPRAVEPHDNRLKIVLLGVGVGFMVGLTSLGSGSVVAVALMAFSRLAPSRIVGTNIAHALVLLSAAALAHWQLGTVDVILAANLLVGSLPGVILGSRLSYYAPARPLKVGMGLLVLAGALKMIRVF
ncbi:MAG: sulfite exporter TauE/SafE family protein, partial [Terriglobia bacterium]